MIQHQVTTTPVIDTYNHIGKVNAQSTCAGQNLCAWRAAP